MPIVPINYRLDDPFIPLSDIDKIDKDDFAPLTGWAGRARPGTWVEFSGAGGTVRKPTGEVLVAAAPTWSDYDVAGLAGHPDSFRLSLLTILVGSHRGRTRYFKRTGAPTVAGASVGLPLTVFQCVAGATEEDVINTAAGATVVEVNDGLLGLASTVTSPAVALCLRGPVNGYIEYYKY
jgi:hypothetical protein